MAALATTFSSRLLPPNPNHNPDANPLFLSLPPPLDPTKRRRLLLLAVAAEPSRHRRRRRTSPPPPPPPPPYRDAFVGDLEEELYEFMQRSAKPGAFPTRAELVAAGRADLADAVAKSGGWLSLGWGLGDDEVVESDGAAYSASLASNSELPSGGFVEGGDGRVEQERHACENSDAGARGVHPEYPEASSSGRSMDVAGSAEEGGFQGILSQDHSQEASSSGRPMDAVASAEDGGIGGILSRLEKERLWSRSMTGSRVSGENGVLITHNGSFAHNRTSSRDVQLESKKGNTHNSVGLHPQNVTLEDNSGSMWRTWSLSRGGFSDFEAAEIHPTDGRKLSEHDNLNIDSVEENVHGLSNGAFVNGSGKSESHSDRDQIRSRLQHLESDLTSALSSLRSTYNNSISEKSSDSSASELNSLSDDWEFQETKVMRAQDELRSIRAKIAVLEGKMALEIIEKQKIIEEKQRRLDAVEKAMSLLHTVYIVWPNSASEVLLAGSFDGWTSQKRMERSAGGIFSLNLRLYPGRYEIKFIVDGTWKIDPLRPTVNNNGFENNVLIVP